MFELFRLIGRVIVDTAGADSAIGKTTKNAMDSADRINGYLGNIKDFVSAAVYAIESSAIAKALKEVWDISSQVAEIGDNIDKSSQKFMLSRQAYQEWAFVAKRSGFDINQLGDAVVDLSKKVGEGKEDTLKILEEIGVSAADAMTATPEELFDMVIKGLQGVDESTRRAYLADQLLGGVAKDLNPLLNTSAEETKKLKDEVHALGGVMSDQLVDQSAKFQDSQTNLQTAWDGVKNHLAEKTLPGMTKIVDGLTLMLTGDFVNGLKTAADGVVDYLNGLDQAFKDFFGFRIIRSDTAEVIKEYGVTPFEGLPASTQDHSGVFGNWKPWLDVPFWMGANTDRTGKFANGLDFVPRDDYPARLHYGEQVLTKQEADDYRAGKSGGGNITINITTTQQSPAQTAAAVAAALTRARWAM